MPRPRTTALIALALAAAALSACGEGGDAGADGASLRAVATTRQVADFVRNVGGDRVSVATLLPANADPHDFEPRPSDARDVAEADVVVQSGGDLDGWMKGLLENAGGDAERTVLIDRVDPLESASEHEVDPHWWQDPRNVVAAVGAIERALAAADPGGAKAYARNARAYVAKVRALDTAIARCMAGIPEERRKLVTNHDAFGYFARRYDIAVLGSIIPALSTSAQPSAGDVRRLVAAIRRQKVTTIFPESALNTRLEQAVARDAGAKVGEPLYADTLGPDEDATYLGAIAHDATLIAGSFGATCDLEATSG